MRKGERGKGCMKPSLGEAHDNNVSRGSAGKHKDPLLRGAQEENVKSLYVFSLYEILC